MTPDVFTLSEQMIVVGDGHELYVQDWGNPDATTPIIFLHGGPGSGCSDRHKSNFEPERQRVIFFDQRGAGRSQPYGALEHNTTKHLVEDIDTLAQLLKLDTFILFGGSWGSSLALFYGLVHPQRVAGMVLHGIWTCSQVENDWVDKGGFRTFYPDAWERYAASVPLEFRDDPSAYHFPRILSDDYEVAKASAYAYNNLEGAAIALDDRFMSGSFETFDPTGTRIEVHYLANQCFVQDQLIFENADKLTMPIWLVQGRQDMVCPPTTAYELDRRLPNSKLIWTTFGHKTERESWNIMRTILSQLTEADSDR